MTTASARPAADVFDAAARALADAGRALEAASRAIAEQRAVEPTTTASPPAYLTTQQVAELTSVSANTLRYWRNLTPPKGPRSFTFEGSKVTYRRSDVEAWLEAQYNAEEAS